MARKVDERRIEYVPVEVLAGAGNPENPKGHNLDGIGASMDRFGFVSPVVVDDRTGLLLSGHGRVETAAAKMAAGADPPDGVQVDGKGRWTMPVVRGLASKDDDDARELLVILNRTVETGGWDPVGLFDLLEGLAAGPGLDGVGYTPMNLADMATALMGPLQYSDETTGDNAARRERNIDELRDNYRNKQVRSIVLDFPLDDYQKLQDVLPGLRRSLGVEDNGGVFLVLLSRWAERQ